MSGMVKTAFVTGGCGFVGRQLIKRLLKDGYSVWILDDLSTGKGPGAWLPKKFSYSGQEAGAVSFKNGEQGIVFIKDDAIHFFAGQMKLGFGFSHVELPRFNLIFHLASVVGGRAKIEGDPMAVAIDLAIDAAFFRWLTMNKEKVGKVLFASSSAAYPIHFQGREGALPLKEEYISFSKDLGMPDMTYGWSKLSGEYLSRIAAEHYGVHTACVRPFSGYGGDQDQTYPIPAIARRAAKKENPFVVWGSGEQGRDFVHIDDCIDAMILVINKIKDGRGVNIGSGRLTTFKKVARIFTELAGYEPKIKPLANKPEGVQSRYADPQFMQKKLRWKPKISLKQGFKRVLEEQTKQIQNSKH